MAYLVRSSFTFYEWWCSIAAIAIEAEYVELSEGRWVLNMYKQYV